MGKIDRRAFIGAVGGAGALLSGGDARAVAPNQQLADRGPLSDTRRLRARINDDDEFRLRARYWDANVRVHLDDASYDVIVRAGAVEDVVPATGAVTSDVTISGPLKVWSGGYLARGLSIEGDPVAHVAPYRGAILRIVAQVRETLGSAPPQATAPETDKQFDAAVGRYLYVRIRGVQYRIYFEEAGRGIPMMVQHLAGSDGRVWRHLLEDEEIQAHFRIIVYDLPYHGRSLPPATAKWWTEPYRPTEGFLIDAILAISKALGLDRPVFLGNGIGGSLAPALAFQRPDDFRAVIAVNSMVSSSAVFARLSGKPVPSNQGPNVAFHPRVGNERHGTTVYELTSPDAPEWGRRELEWIFRQGAPGVFAGDLEYFANDYDLSGGRAERIDTSKVSVHFISGEHQAAGSVGPNSAKSLSEKIHGSTYSVSPSGSHPIVEDYARFRQTLLPVLNRIRAGTAASR